MVPLAYFRLVAAGHVEVNVLDPMLVRQELIQVADLTKHNYKKN